MFQVELLEDRVVPSINFVGPTTLHAGDRVSIDVDLSATLDSDENGEGEPLQVLANGRLTPGAVPLPVPVGTMIFSNNSFNTIKSTPYLATADVTLTASFVNSDGDEDATITVTVTTGLKPRFNTDEKNAFADLADEWNLQSSRDWRASLLFAAAGSVSGFAAAVSAAPTLGTGAVFFGTVTLGLGIDAAILGVQATYDSDKAIMYNRLNRDPFDSNFATVAQPIVKRLYFLSQDPTVISFVPTFQALMDNEAKELALLDAFNTAANRANSAQQSNDPASETLQQQAIANFSRQLESVLTVQPALLTAVQSAVKTLAGTTDLTASRSDIATFADKLRTSGFNDTSKQLLTLTGHSAADIQAITNTVFAQNQDMAAGDPIAAITNPILLGKLQAAIGALRAAVGTSGPTPQFAVGADVGGSGAVTVYNSDGKVAYTATPFANSTAGARPAVADFNGDGVADIVAGSGPGVANQVVIIDGKTQQPLLTFQPFEASFTGGLFVAIGDVNGDGVPDIIVTPDQSGGPIVAVYDGAALGKGTATQLARFFGIDDQNFRGGARASFGDINGDGIGDLIIAAGFGGGPRIAIFNGNSLVAKTQDKLVGDFFLFEQTLRNGVFISAGDLNGDGFADIIAGGGPGGGPRVLALSGKDLVAGTNTQLANFFAGDATGRGGIRITVKDLDSDGIDDLVVAPGSGAASRVTAYAGKSIKTDGVPPELLGIDALPGFSGGVFVG